MLILYDKDEKEFLSNGIGKLDKYAFNDEVAEELNGIFKLQFDYPIFAKHADKIIGDNIIRATTPDSEQPFFISKIVKEDGYLHITAYHVFYKLVWELIEDMYIVKLNGQAALNRLLENTQFTGFSDIEKISSIRIVRYNVVEAILNKEKDNTVISRFGGELKRDKFNIELRNRRGRYYKDFPFEISYAKNLKSYEADVDFTNVATRVMPIGFNGLLLPEKYVIKPGADLDHLKTAKAEYSSIKAASDPEDIQEGELPYEEAIEALRQAALKDFEDGAFDAKAHYRIEFQDLATTEEYKNKAILQKLYLGDEALVMHKEDDINILARVIAYRWSPVRKEYIEIELGNYQEKFTDLKPVLETIAGKLEEYKTDFEKNIDEVTLLLTRTLGGYVLKSPGELFIMDTEDPNTAQKVWRWNLSGLGYSGTGINGPYEIAITMEGKILAKFIQTYNLSAISADLGEVTAGIIRSADGATWINLNNSSFSLADKITYIDGVWTVKLANGDDLDEKMQSFTETQQDYQNFKNTIQIGGGNNIIKNSVGYGDDFNFWTVVSGVIKKGISSWILDGIAKHGWIISSGVMQQDMDLLLGMDLTISGRLIKYTSAGSILIGLYDPDTDQLIHTVINKNTTEVYDGQFSFAFNTENYRKLRLKITASGISTVNPSEITDLMLAQGINVDVWSQANGEIYTLNVKVDSKGISVYSADNKGKTVMSPEEFAGYYNNQKIFTLNGDITEVMGLEIKGKGLWIRPLKIVQTSNSIDFVWTGV